MRTALSERATGSLASAGGSPKPPRRIGVRSSAPISVSFTDADFAQRKGMMRCALSSDPLMRSARFANAAESALALQAASAQVHSTDPASKRVAPAKLIAQGNELAGIRRDSASLNKYELRGAQGNTWSNLQKGPAWQRHRNLMEANALRRMAPALSAAQERGEGARPWRCPIALRAFVSGWAFSHSRWLHEQQPRYQQHGQAS